VKPKATNSCLLQTIYIRVLSSNLCKPAALSKYRLGDLVERMESEVTSFLSTSIVYIYVCAHAMRCLNSPLKEGEKQGGKVPSNIIPTSHIIIEKKRKKLWYSHK